METKKIAYIAGALNGTDLETTEARYLKKQEELEAAGYFVYNPITILKNINGERLTMGLPELTGSDTDDRGKIVSFGISLMAAADELHLLGDWQENEGAAKEQTIANLIPMTIIYPQSV